jgi:TonB-dependent receptor
MRSIHLRSSLARLVVFFLLLCGLSAQALAQQGSIAGVVVDSQTGETLIGANVVIEGTLTGATTDLDGFYKIQNLTPGAYTLVFSYIGYSPSKVQAVNVLAGQVARVDMQMVPAAIGLDEVVVEARAVRDAEAALLRDRQKAIAVSDAISAEAISRSASSTASDAMQKVTGASVVGGRYVFVRGLGDRYMNTQLNGSTLPSADPDRNAVAFDLFPSGLLDNIITVKTFTPDQPGNFTGGSVNIATKDYPDDLSFSLSTSLSYNSATGLGDDYLTFGGGVGRFADNAPQLPEALLTGTIPTIGASDQKSKPEEVANAERLNQLSRSFNPVMEGGTASAPVNQSYSLSLGNQMQLAGRPLGFIGSFSYSSSVSAYTDGTSARYKGGRDVTVGSELTPNFELGDTRGSEEVLWGGMAKLAYKFHPRHELSLNYIQNRSAEATARYQLGTISDFTGGFFETRSLQYVDRRLSTYQAKGQHAITGQNLKVDWTVTYSQTMQDEPDLRFFANNYSENEEEPGDLIYEIRLSNYPAPTRYFRNLEEDVWSSNLSVIVPFKQWGGIGAQFKLGGAYEMKDRTFRERWFEFRQDVSATLFDQVEGDPNAYFAQYAGLLPEPFSTQNFNRYGLYLIDQTRPANSYDGTQDVAAAFAQLEIPLTQRLRFIGGARFETTQLDIASLDSTLNASGRGQGRLDNNDLLPSANLIYQLSDQMNVRFAYGRTLARPNFREMAPYSTFNFIGDYIFTGNPTLRRTLTNNFDLRWEWFMRPGEIIAVSTFYKGFMNPIERVLLSDNGELQPRNVADATVYGAEFEFRKRLDGVAPALSNFQLGANLTLVQSDVQIADEELLFRRAVDPNAPSSRQLQGQSPFVFNIDLAYDNPKTGTSSSLFYNVFGKRLSEVSIGGTPDVFEKTAGDLDLTLTQRLAAGFRAKFSAKNLLDAQYKLFQEFNGIEYINRAYDRGRTFSLGVSYSLD